MMMIYGLLGTNIGSCRPLRSCGNKIIIRSIISIIISINNYYYNTI